MLGIICVRDSQLDKFLLVNGCANEFNRHPQFIGVPFVGALSLK